MFFNIEADLGICWMDPIIHCLKDGSLPTHSGETHLIRAQASRYWLSPD